MLVKLNFSRKYDVATPIDAILDLFREETEPYSTELDPIKTKKDYIDGVKSLNKKCGKQLILFVNTARNATVVRERFPWLGRST
jgi:hypothetical protein